MQKGNLRVLVVDDESDVLEVTCRVLLRLEHKPTAADGGAKAIELLQTEQFDLAVVDTQMPDVDGNAVRRFIKESLPDLKVITASALPPEEMDADSLPQHHMYLRKPYAVADFVDAIKKLTQCCQRT